MNSHSWEATEKPFTYRLRCDVTKAADALAEAVEAEMGSSSVRVASGIVVALAEYRKVRPVEAK